MLRGAVIGCGAMGRNHIRVLSGLAGVELVGVADTDPDLTQTIASKYRVTGYVSASELYATTKPDFVVIAVPTLHHYEAGCTAIAENIDLLLEKPIAATIDQGHDLVRRAQESNVLLVVGHVERYNPAILELKRRLDAGELGRVYHAAVRRLGPFPERVRDVGVVLDLAPHDIDVLHFLFGASVERVYAETEQRINTVHEDMVSASMRFTNGVVASLDINWLTPAKVRALTVTGERGMFEVDYLTQDLTFYANDYALTRWEALRALSGVSEGTMTRYRIAKEEPLRNELLAFVNAVARRRGVVTVSNPDGPSPVSATDGLEALRLATLLVQSGRLGQAIQVRHDNPAAA